MCYRVPRRFEFLAFFLALIIALAPEPLNANTPHRQPAQPALSTFDDSGILRLSPARQQRGGLRTRIIESSEIRPESRAFGQVLPLAPLIEFAQLFKAAESEKNIAAAAEFSANSVYRQVESLYLDHATARFKLEQSKIEWLSAKARHKQVTARLEAIRLGALQSWGEVLTGWAENPDGPEFAGFLRRNKFLLGVSLPSGTELSQDLNRVFVNRVPERSHAIAAELISSSPQAGEKSQGESYFFECAGDSLRTGMQLYVWIPVPGSTRRGIEIPADALVWKDGKPWIYRKTGEDSFQRYRVASAFDHGERWYLPDHPESRAEIVIEGAQMLLSEEYRWQIPDEDDD